MPDLPALGLPELGCLVARISWTALNPEPGVFDFTNLDTWISEYESHGVEMIYTFGRPPAWAGGSDPNPNAWHAFVSAIIAMPQVTSRSGRDITNRAPVYSLEPPQNWLACSATSTLLQNQSTLVHVISPANLASAGSNAYVS